MRYSDPLQERYASKEIRFVFSDDNRYQIWRKIWLELAKAQKDLGLDIKEEQIKQMQENITNIDFEEVARIEKELNHDVMSHLHEFANKAPLAKAIIHLGATSESIKDNTDIILIREAIIIIRDKLKLLIEILSKFVLENKDIATLGWTHYQVAQPTTVGKRAAMWLQSFFIDLKELDNFIDNLKFRGVKGTTGTQGSFKDLFQDYKKVKELDKKITKAFGFKNVFNITGQTYDRKQDAILLNIMSQVAISAHKITNDIRLLQNLKEIEESFGKKQIGSSAMPYKKNPIKSERVSSLAKYLISLPFASTMVASTQWLERTLDDSAARRVYLPNAFFTLDAILELLIDIVGNLKVNHKVIAKNIRQELPFLATESILMEAVKMGGDRQDLHEKIRQFSINTKLKMVEEGAENDLLDKILQDKSFNLTKEKLDKILNIENFIGYAKEQAEDFIKNEVITYIEK